VSITGDRQFFDLSHEPFQGKVSSSERSLSRGKFARKVAIFVVRLRPSTSLPDTLPLKGLHSVDLLDSHICTGSHSSGKLVSVWKKDVSLRDLDSDDE
jgi:hypothetical protein